MAITLQTIESLPLVEEVNENTSLVGWDGEKTVRIPNVVTYNTEDQKAGSVPVNEKGVLMPHGGGSSEPDAIIHYRSGELENGEIGESAVLVKGNVPFILDKLAKGELCTVWLHHTHAFEGDTTINVSQSLFLEHYSGTDWFAVVFPTEMGNDSILRGKRFEVGSDGVVYIM